MKYKDKEEGFEKKMDEAKAEFKKKMEQMEKDYDKKQKALNLHEFILKRTLHSQTPFKETARMAADMETCMYEKDERYLRYKPHPAASAADKLREIKKECNRKLAEYKEVSYKYDFILQVFPEIKWYVENDAELLSAAEYISYSDLSDGRDRSRDYLSQEEWQRMSVTERNQLALDRYVQKRNKSSWAVGRDYEMSCAHICREKGYFVEMQGIEKRFGDLGRDIIASRFEENLFETDYSKGEILIIQCKCWNKHREIRENVIMQLLGTTIAYRIENEKLLGKDVKVTPVLMVPSFSVLSETARRFAQVLNIQVKVQDFVDFPRIKCNVNGNNRIYHLPFDQQYDAAQIKLDGEFYAFTVKEAESKGFRRAMRHIVTSQSSG